jgi:anti-sigma regulatory factor (Ser/Thr protein kinase)
MAGLTIATEVNTGALVVTAVGCLNGLARLRRGVCEAIRQRPSAVVVDLSRLTAACALPALALGLGGRRHGVRVLTRVPPSLRGLRRMPGVTCEPLPAALAALPGLGQAEERVGARFAPEVDAPGVARALVSEAVSAWQVDHLDLPAQLIASELVSNAVEHAGTAVDFRLVRTWYGLCIAVRDGDPHPPAASVSRAAPDDSVSPRGRGLAIVARTASRWGYLIGTADKIVWAMLRDTLARPVRVRRHILVLGHRP